MHSVLSDDDDPFLRNAQTEIFVYFHSNLKSLSSKEKNQGYQWQISFLVWRKKEGWRENDKYENVHTLYMFAFFFFLAE